MRIKFYIVSARKRQRQGLIVRKLMKLTPNSQHLLPTSSDSYRPDSYRESSVFRLLSSDFTNYIIISFVLLLFVACSSTSYYSEQSGLTDYVNIYNPLSSNLQPKVFFYHQSENKTLLFFKVDASLMVSEQKLDASSKNQARLELKYAIRDTKTREIVDTASFIYEIPKQKEADFITSVPLDLKAGNNYSISLLFIDKVKQSWKRVWANIPKENMLIGETFFIDKVCPETEPLFVNYCHKKDSIICRSDVFYNKPFYLMFFGTDSLTPKPIFDAKQSFRFTGLVSCDTTISSGDTVRLKHKGFYKISTDSLKPESGRELLLVDDYYPYVKTPEAMLKPLVYITNDSRFRTLSKAENLKQEIEKFWIEKGKSMMVARELIKIYYNRVQTANQYFTSTREGWQTDRGMVYVLFGLPKHIYKAENQEEWVYLENHVNTNLIFRFTKDSLSLSNNDYSLIRNKRYETAWKQAVSSWENGKAYSIQ